VNLYRCATQIAGLVLVVSVLVAGAIRAASEPDIVIAVKGRANANASIATSGAFVAVAWAARTREGITDAYAATSRDGGRSFQMPVRVNQIAGDVSVSGEQPPRIALIPNRAADSSLVVMWTAKAPSGTRLISARSTDGGRPFGPAASVPGSDASGNRGWESLAVGANGEPVAVFLRTKAGNVGVGADITRYAVPANLQEPYGSPSSYHAFVHYALNGPGSIRTSASRQTASPEAPSH
jgi:hypothetical protein